MEELVKALVAVEDLGQRLHDRWIDFPPAETPDGLEILGTEERRGPAGMGRYKLILRLPGSRLIALSDPSENLGMSVYDVEAVDGTLRFVAGEDALLVVSRPTGDPECAVGKEPYALRSWWRWRPT